MKRVLGNIMVIFLNFLIQINFIRIVNEIYNLSPFLVKDYLKKRLKQPKNTVYWKILLRNKKKITLKVTKGIYNEWDFALSYNQHDIGLCIVEQILNEYYDKKYCYFYIGANMGLRSLYALSIGRDVVLFEPNIDLHEFTKNMFSQNHINNFEIEPLCISDFNEQTKFFISKSSYISSLSRTHAEKEGVSKEVEVHVITLNDYINKNPEKVPLIIKIDVEGSELNVLKGAEALIEKYKPAFIIEILDNEEEIFLFLLKFEYNIFKINNKIVNFLEPINETYIKSACTNFLFVHDNTLLKKLY